MPDTAGSLLLSSGLVSEEQVLEAEHLRQQLGGTLAESLVRTGAVDEEALVDFFHRRLLVPRVEPEQFERIQKRALAAVPADMAAEFRIFPIEIDPEGTLTLAMADPSNAGVADEVGFFTDRFCQRAVAHPSLIRAAIQHYYGVHIEENGPGRTRSAPSLELLGAFPEELEVAQAAGWQASVEADGEVNGHGDGARPARPQLEVVSGDAAVDGGAALPEVEVAVAAPPAPTPKVESRRSSRPDETLPLRPRPSPLPATAPPPSERAAVAPPAVADEEPVVLLTRVKQGPPAILVDPAMLSAPAVPTASSAEPDLDDEDMARTLLRSPSSAGADALAAAFDAAPGDDPSASGGEPDTEFAEPILLTRRIVRPRQELAPLAATPAVPNPDPPLAALRSAGSRDQVAAALLDYLIELAPRAALFVARKGTLVGFAGRGATLELDALRHVQLAVDAPSLFRDVLQSRLPYRGPLLESAVNRAFARLMGELAGDVLIFPVSVREKVVAVMYADGVVGPLPDATLHAVAREAGHAYERLILEAKR